MSSHETYISNFYTNRSSTYNDSWHPAFAALLLNTAVTSCPSLKTTASPILLDLACGTGLVTLAALTHPHLPSITRIIGIDISPGMLSVARARLAAVFTPEQQSRVQLLQHSMLSPLSHPALKPLEGHIDIITCASAFVLLANAEERAAALTEWESMLKPGSGRLVFDVTHEHNLRAGLVMEAVGKRLGLRTPGERGWITGEQSVRELVRGCKGLDVERVEVVAQTGEGVQRLEKGREVAEKKFERMIGVEAYSEFRGKRQDEAREAFVEEWAKAAGEDGLVEVVDGVYVVVARMK